MEPQTTFDPRSQLKRLAPYLDPHLLLFLLKRNVGDESKSLQDQIKSQLIGADPKKAAEKEKAAEDKANKLLTLLKDQSGIKKMRDEQNFNFEKLSAGEKKITIQDCQDLFDYAKILFELQKYSRK